MFHTKEMIGTKESQTKAFSERLYLCWYLRGIEGLFNKLIQL